MVSSWFGSIARVKDSALGTEMGVKCKCRNPTHIQIYTSYVLLVIAD